MRLEVGVELVLERGRGPEASRCRLALELALPSPRADALRLDRLEEIGRMFRDALDLSRGEPDTMGHRAAWGWAEKATKALCEFVGEDMQLAPVLKAAAAKLR
ncbi:MAG: hypothetical protein ABI895_29190 [Deltaproteobacteria bacterium]